MDHGAARSRKQANLAKLDPTKIIRKPVAKLQAPASTPSATSSGPSRFKPKVIDNTDPARFRPKAIRDSVALIWSQSTFPLPPPADILANVTRVDLTGSACTDVSWLSGTKVTWLSLKGCKIEKGWDEVGSLANLAGTSRWESHSLTCSLEYFRYRLEESPEIFQRAHQSQSTGCDESALDTYGRGYGQPLESAQFAQ